MQLASKMRFISAQLLRLFEGDLWRETAGHANAMARRLADGSPARRASRWPTRCRRTPCSPRCRAAVIERLHERYHFYVWDEDGGVVRLMCAWQTTPA